VSPAYLQSDDVSTEQLAAGVRRPCTSVKTAEAGQAGPLSVSGALPNLSLDLSGLELGRNQGLAAGFGGRNATVDPPPISRV
jgi:hypothetical protein